MQGERIPDIQGDVATTIAVTHLIIEYLETSDEVMLPSKVEAIILQNVLQWLHSEYTDIVNFIEHLLHIAERSSLFVLVKCGTDAVIAVPIDIALGSLLVDVFTVGKVETPVIVLGVIGAVGSGSSVVSC